MPWLHGLKAAHEQQKESQESEYLKNKPFLQSSKYFWNPCKKLLEKNITSRGSRP